MDEQMPVGESNPNPETSAGVSTGDGDVEQNKGMAILAYFLFFVPLLAAKESKFAMFHANQSLLLVLTAIGVSVVSTVVPVIGWLIIGPLGSLAVLVLWVTGLINAAQGQMKPLPLIGKFEILKWSPTP